MPGYGIIILVFIFPILFFVFTYFIFHIISFFAKSEGNKKEELYLGASLLASSLNLFFSFLTSYPLFLLFLPLAIFGLVMSFPALKERRVNRITWILALILLLLNLYIKLG
jgi:phosphate/sulfate permease